MLVQSKRQSHRLDTETSQIFVEDYMRNPYDNIEVGAPKNNARNISINGDLRNQVGNSSQKRSGSAVSMKSLNNMQRSMQKDLSDK